MNLFCDKCRQRCHAALYECGAGADCCFEAALLTPADSEPLFADDLAMTAKQAWQSGMDYDDLHIHYVSPSRNCECDACDRGREWEAAAEKLDEDDPTWDNPRLRPLTPFEEEELLRDLYADLEQSETPHQRAQRNWRYSQ